MRLVGNAARATNPLDGTAPCLERRVCLSSFLLMCGSTHSGCSSPTRTPRAAERETDHVLSCANRREGCGVAAKLEAVEGCDARKGATESTQGSARQTSSLQSALLSRSLLFLKSNKKGKKRQFPSRYVTHFLRVLKGLNVNVKKVWEKRWEECSSDEEQGGKAAAKDPKRGGIRACLKLRRLQAKARRTQTEQLCRKEKKKGEGN